MPTEQWTLIQSFVCAAVLEAVDATPYSVPELMYALARHTSWCRFTAGLDLDRESVFDRRTIAHAVSQQRQLSPASQSNLRAQLLRIAEVLLPSEAQLRLPVLPAASPSAPYAIAELNSFRAWANGQPTPRARLSAAALLSLGAGAGLPARELAVITPREIMVDDDGVLVRVTGPRGRVVPLLHSWEEVLLEVLGQTPPTAPLFRPGHTGFYPNIVTNFVARSAGVEAKPQSPRLRATWVVTLLSSGAPPRALMEAAGVSSLEALTRYLPFVPEPQPSLARFALRYAEL